VDYNASGQITSTRYGNNVTSDYTYDPKTLRLSNILTRNPTTGAVFQDLDYLFDPVDNVTHISDLVNSMTQDFLYDDLNRLIQATGNAYGIIPYEYDPIGNMTRKGNLTLTYGVSPPPSGGGTKPHAVTRVRWSSGKGPTFGPTGSPGNVSLQYDANGNMTKRGSDLLVYDSENRLKSMTVYEGKPGTTTYTFYPGKNLISFTYLPENRSITSVLSPLQFGVDYDQVSYWDPVSNTEKKFINDPALNDFTTFEYGRSYDVRFIGATAKTITVSGISPATNVTFNAKVGDNFIGPAVKSSISVTTVLSGWKLHRVQQEISFNECCGSMCCFHLERPGPGHRRYGGCTAMESCVEQDILLSSWQRCPVSRSDEMAGVLECVAARG